MVLNGEMIKFEAVVQFDNLPDRFVIVHARDMASAVTVAEMKAALAAYDDAEHPNPLGARVVAIKEDS